MKNAPKGRRGAPGLTPPGPRGRRLVGNLQAFEEDRLGFLMSARADFGGVVRFDKRTTIINDPDVARSVLNDRSGAFVVRQSYLQKHLDDEEIAVVQGSRHLLNPGLRQTRVRAAGADAGQLARAEFRESAGRDPGGFDPMPVLERVVSAAVARHYFADGAASLPSASGALLDVLGDVIGNPFALPESWRSPTRRRIERRHRELRAEVVALLDRRVRSPGSYDDASAEMLTARDPSKHDVERLASMIIGSLLAAQRVPAAAGSWMVMLVADHQPIQDQLVEESRRFTREGADDGPMSFPRANAVLMEALRLYPPTWLISRSTERPVELSGFLLPAKHNILISPYVLHRDERHFPQPHQFLPERWNISTPPPAAYLPFGRGLHGCPGSNLASVVLLAILLSVVGEYRISRAPSLVTPDPRTTLVPRNLLISLAERASSSAEAAPQAFVGRCAMPTASTPTGAPARSL